MPYRDYTYFNPENKPLDEKVKEAFYGAIQARRTYGHPDFNEQEKNYQYSIIRFLIRSGFFDPTRAACYKNNNVDYQDLLNSIKDLPDPSIIQPLRKTLLNDGEIEKNSGQFASSIHRHSFDHQDKYSDQDNADLDKVIDYIDKKHPEFLNSRIAVFEIGLFWLIEHERKDKFKESGNTIDFIYWLPILTNWRGKKTGGTVFINSDQRVKGLPQSIDQDTPVPQSLITMLHYLTGLVSENQIKEIEDTVRGEALNSAAISIMSRNISHNLGSHVLSYLKKKLGDEKQILEEGVLDNLIKKVDDQWMINTRVVHQGQLQLNKLATPYLRSISRLLEYFQERQDYVGAIAAKWHLYFSPINFRDQIFNYFFKPTKVLTDYNKQVQAKNLILDYITYSEGFKRQDIKFSFIPPLFNDAPEVAIPTGITGRQGFFTILENLIRNTAKHGDAKKDRGGELKLQIRLQVDSDHLDYYQVTITDNGGPISGSRLQKLRTL